jgi:hypothetical protein
MNTQAAASWLVFTTSLSGRPASTPRVRLWRALKELGVVPLRDGVVLLPASTAHREKLQSIGAQVEAAGGTAWLFEVPPQSAATQIRLHEAFDCSADWLRLSSAMNVLRTELAQLDEAGCRRRLRQLERELENVARIDFFPNAAQAQAREMLAELTLRANRRFSPEEPGAATGAVPRLHGADYRGRLWATRKHLWVDRAASAWLIHRCIDTTARFVWLDTPEDCPAEALGFDFDGAAFTHVGERVSFEVLLASFGLDTDTGLATLGRLVHYLDVGGEPVAAAAGFEAVLAGLRDSTADDDALLAAVTPVLDALYRHFATPA